ncbi:hypothetical protein PsAD5_02524 [Pseudovibrio sp. Ad5]|uniref:DUF3168 domain-containing protein n=1 Tax=Pseudovibrio sp. Ad5 TaxID=989436 RepID=UPI0007AEBFB7|nr:DUF3168 domain-containing protein [Pseudovibrio sp. Ad5]KZK96337.1 hypothetical protein PsAD5_02524 [Pseudovibrio sp. Ad5]
MMEFAVELQRWLFRALTVPEIDQVKGVFDHKPKGDGRYPFIEIGESNDIPDHAQGSPGGEHVITLHIWSQASGQTELKTIMAEICRRVDCVGVDIDGPATCFAEVEHTQSLGDPDGETRHGVIAVQFTTRKLES